MQACEVLIGKEAVFISMVADGHGGNGASVYCHKHMLDHFIEAAAGEPDAKSLRHAARSTFERLHREVLELDPPTTAGSTLTICALNPKRREITCAHVGDSVALLVPQSGDFTELCEDHRIETSARERTRLLAAGGAIAPASDRHGRPGGPLRLWPGGVAQARSIGDSDIGAFNDSRPYTSSYPFPACVRADVVVCSDGVWDALHHASVAAICRKAGGCTAGTVARLIVKASLQQRHAYDNQDGQIPRDDTSCVVIRIGEAETASDSLGGGCFWSCLQTRRRASGAAAPSASKAAAPASEFEGQTPRRDSKPAARACCRATPASGSDRTIQVEVT
uniref:PPM-type phosphatase domain-containing protein n=1 Tax=Haptolina ericina TaxID=156174 RepID=A0A7S3FB46_9EUKA